MTKADLILTLATAMETTYKQAEMSLNATLAALADVLIAGESIVLPGFGTFGVKTRAARQGINPATQKPLSIPETQVAYFKAGSKLKEAVAKAKPAASAKTKTAVAEKAKTPAKKVVSKGKK